MSAVPTAPGVFFQLLCFVPYLPRVQRTVWEVRQLPFPTPGDLPDPGTEPVSPALVGGFFTSEPCWKSCQVPHLGSSKQ